MISSGRNLQKQLNEVGLDIEKINFVELVKCFPKDNGIRRPTKDKINNFREWLDRQIDIVRPRVIVPMGQDAWEFFYRATLYKKPKIKFTKFVNKNMELPPYKKCKVIPIFRPSATNNKYNPKNIEILKKIVKYC